MIFPYHSLHLIKSRQIGSHSWRPQLSHVNLAITWLCCVGKLISPRCNNWVTLPLGLEIISFGFILLLLHSPLVATSPSLIEKKNHSKLGWYWIIGDFLVFLGDGFVILKFEQKIYLCRIMYIFVKCIFGVGWFSRYRLWYWNL